MTIDKQSFKIGKEKRNVSLCISDNTNVSRVHAEITYRDGAFYIRDNSSTNGTSVNGVGLSVGQERRLSNGDVLRLADEEFTFRQ